MAYETNGKNLMLNALGNACTHAALFTDDAGTIEVTGGTPAYARKAITFAAADAGSMAANGTLPAFDVPACTVKAIGLMSAVTAGTKYVTINVTDEVFAAQGTYTITAGTLDLNA